MKIESNNSTLATLQSSTVRATDAVEASGAIDAVQKTGAISSTVSLSSMSTLRSASVSDIDTAKVASIKAALRDGTYKIDSSKIADGMLSTVRDMLHATAH